MALPVDKTGDRPVLEITDRMIAAGVKELNLSFDSEGHLDDPADVVADVFRAMILASPSDRRSF
ncbi:MAG: hypothetical protein KGL39_29645 [Patescibacteria group bacterium]|nr:hypothetical protein [Patescibacteria group bacterium]